MGRIDGPKPIMMRVRRRQVSEDAIPSLGRVVGFCAERREDRFDGVSVDEIHESVLQTNGARGRMRIRLRTGSGGRGGRESRVGCGCEKCACGGRK